MGLCKCPKKKVTNQFCFEHRVNVCEHCMVVNHPRCIVQSYLQWLQDSDYNPICELCQSQLGDGDCVRLICYHVFHWDCLNNYAVALPAHTAPDGYLCPTCKSGIFPPDNAASPVADHVRQILSKVNWARVAMGMLTLDDFGHEQLRARVRAPNYESVAANNASYHGNVSPASSDSWTMPLSNFTSTNVSKESAEQFAPSSKSAAVQFAEQPDMFSGVQSTYTPRKMYDATDGDLIPNVSFDHVENKYKRRSALEWFARWFKSYTRPKARHDPHRRFKRCFMIAVLVIISLLTLIMIFQRLGRASADDDPFLDPMANPHIRVGQNSMNAE